MIQDGPRFLATLLGAFAFVPLACGKVESNETEGSDRGGADGVSTDAGAGRGRPTGGQTAGAPAGFAGTSFAGSSSGAGGLVTGGASNPTDKGGATGDGGAAGSNVRGRFRSLGFPSGTDLIDEPAISADGSVVVATATLKANFWDRLEAVKWTLDGGFESLALTNPDLPNPVTSSATSVSGDGSIVVGDQRFLSYRPFLHREQATQYLLPENSEQSSTTWDVSDDGSVVVGMLTEENGDSHAFRWTAETGMVELESLAESLTGSAYAVSGDGRIAVGFSGDNIPVMWDADGILHVLPVPDSLYGGDPRGVNYDGSKIAGSSHRHAVDGSPVPSTATLWVNGIWQELAPLPGAIANYARDVSADGSVVVGTSDEAAIWINGAPAQSIRSLFEDAGHDLAGWRLYAALSVSGDGRVVAGTGSYEERDQVWIAWLP